MYILFLVNYQKSYSFSFKHTTHNKTKILGNKKHYWSVLKHETCQKKNIFLHNFSKFMGILLFVLKYMYICLLLKMIDGFPRGGGHLHTLICCHPQASPCRSNPKHGYLNCEIMTPYHRYSFKKAILFIDLPRTHTLFAYRD